MTNDFNKLQKDLRTLTEPEWEKRGERMALALFQRTAKQVPAYKKFLKKMGIDPHTIRTIADFRNVPLTTKENYLKAYPLNELLPGGKMDRTRMISASSGSSGKPFFWPRNIDNITEAALIHELIFTEFFDVAKKRTLFVNTFAMGMWVAGTTTFESVERIAEKYGITVVTPGIDVEQILSVISATGKFYDQIIIAGYPPFVKDVIEAGRERNIGWEKLHIRFLFAAESFSEDWRTHMHEAVGARTGIFTSLNIYGTADALVVAHETPLSILIRRMGTENRNLHRKLFGNDLRVPTCTQYNPAQRYFEELPDSKLIFSASGGIPLVRYDIGDTGNILHLPDITRLFESEGVHLAKEARKVGIAAHTWKLPFITIYGRDKMTTSLYGLKIYPEHVRGALDTKLGNQYVTGRFVMSTKTDSRKNQFLEIHIELRPKVRNNAIVANHIQKKLLEHLRTVNSEYRRLHEAIGVRAVPKIRLHAHQSSSLFDRKGKQKWKE